MRREIRKHEIQAPIYDPNEEPIMDVNRIRELLPHRIIIFVSGKASSNGKVLCDLCKSCNIRTYHIDSEEELREAWFRPDDNVGVCGATSTPKWLLEKVARRIEALL